MRFGMAFTAGDEGAEGQLKEGMDGHAAGVDRCYSGRGKSPPVSFLNFV